jgi:hypothetical protein
MLLQMIDLLLLDYLVVVILVVCFRIHLVLQMIDQNFLLLILLLNL